MLLFAAGPARGQSDASRSRGYFFQTSRIPKPLSGERGADFDQALGPGAPIEWKVSIRWTIRD